MWIADVSVVGSALGSDSEGPEKEVREELREKLAENSDSVSDSDSDAEVVEPASDSSRSEAASPACAYVNQDLTRLFGLERHTYSHEPLVVVRLPLIDLLSLFW